MPVFQYCYLNEMQKKKKGLIGAENYESAKAKLLKSHSHILTLREHKGRNHRCKVSAEKLSVFTKQLRLLLKSGLPVYESLCNLEEHYWDGVLGTIIRSLTDRLREGISLSEAMEEYPQTFDEFYRNTVLSGEAIGDLENALERLEDKLRAESAFSKQIVSSLSYPLVLAFFSFGIICFFLLFVVPSLQELLEDRTLNRVTKIVFGTANFLKTFKWYLPGVVIGMGLPLFLRRSRFYLFKYVSSFLMKFNWISQLIVKWSLSRFFRVLHALLQGDGNLVTAVAIASRTLYPEKLREAFQESMTQVVAGSRLSRELSRYKFLPKTVVQMIALGEDTGDLSKSAGYLADSFEEEVRRILQLFVAWSQPVVLIVLGGVIAVVMLSVLIPLTSGFDF